MKKRSNVLVGLDIGTTKTTAIVGEITETGVDIIGIGTSQAKEIRKGTVVNIDSMVESIKTAVEEAEHMSGCRINSVYVGISGSHIKGQNSLSIVSVKGREVDEGDVQRAIEASKAIAIPVGREIMHILPQSYVIDGQEGIKDPIGMSGVRLEAKVHIVTGATSAIQDIVKSVNRVGLDIDDIVLEQLAAGEAVLSADEKDLGVVLVDIGGSNTSITIFSEASIKHTAILPVGGNYLTSDISTGLCTSLGERVEKILNLAYNEIVRFGFKDLLAAGVVLTGGTSLLPGISELAEQIFDMPARKGIPIGVGGLSDIVNSPAHAIGVGLIIYGNNQLGGDPIRNK